MHPVLAHVHTHKAQCELLAKIPSVCLVIEGRHWGILHARKEH